MFVKRQVRVERECPRVTEPIAVVVETDLATVMYQGANPTVRA
jgi:hypothetical protein